MNQLPEARAHRQRLHRTTMTVAVHHQSVIRPETRVTIAEFVSASFKSAVRLEFTQLTAGTDLATLIEHESAYGKLLLCEGAKLCGEIAALENGASVIMLYMYLETTPSSQRVKSIWLLSPQGEQLQVYDHQEGSNIWNRLQW